MGVFNSYSKYYDLLYQDKDYNAEVNYIISLIKKFNPSTKSILDLGCGTGKHASILQQSGYNIFGIDISETMLERAKNLNIDCSLQDVRTFRMDRKFDTVLSLFHVASYQNTDEDVLNYFETASYHLNTDGIFIFDLWYKPAVLKQTPEKRIKELEDDYIKVKRYCIPQIQINKNIVDVNYEIEIIDKHTGNKEIIKETHSMRYFDEKEIINFANEKGIKIIHSEEWLAGNKPSENTWGVCFIGIKV